MPRRSGTKSGAGATQRKTKTSTTPNGPVTKLEPAVKPHNNLVKPQPAAPDPKDERLVGYQFPNHAGATPFDYAVDANTGKVKSGGIGGGQPLWGVKMQDISIGIKDAILPPLSIWKSGRWLQDIDDEDAPIRDMKIEGWKDVENNIWLVSGEGSPGCYAFLAFFVPNKEADAIVPRHPMLWGAEWKNTRSVTFTAKTHPEFASTPKDPRATWLKTWEILEYGFLFEGLEETEKRMKEAQKAEEKKPWSMTQWDGYDRTGVSSPRPSTPPPKGNVLPGPKTGTTVTSLPVAVRFRCPGCGHWYKESDFVTHNKHSLCPALDNGVADWTVVCDSQCGCELIEGFPSTLHTLGEKTLDHVSTPKPGFPRPKKEEVKTLTETTETPEEGGEGTETTEGTESTEGTEEGGESTEGTEEGA